MKKDVAGQHISAQLTSATDGSDITSGASVQVSGDGGAAAAGTGTLTHIANGSWDYAPVVGETNYDHIAFIFTATGAVSVTVQVFTDFPQSGDTYGALPTNISLLAIDSSGDVTFNNTSIATATNLTNLPSIPANWLTATGVAASALNGKGDWNVGKTGYSISGTITTLDGLNNIAAGDVWDVTLSGHLTAGTTGNALNAAGSAGDPWSTSIPGAYGAGTAGYILGNNLDATVSTRLPTASITLTGGAVTVGTNNDKTGYSLTQTFPTNFADMAIAVTTGEVTVGTNNDKTGYTASTVSDKTGYALTTAYDPAKTAAQAGDAMTLTTAYDAAKTAAQAGDSMDITSVNSDTTAATNLAKTGAAIGRGTVTTGGTTTSIPTSAFAPSGVAADQFKGRVVTFDADTTTTSLRGQSTDITANTAAATPTLTVTALTTAPSSGDTFSVT